VFFRPTELFRYLALKSTNTCLRFRALELLHARIDKMNILRPFQNSFYNVTVSSRFMDICISVKCPDWSTFWRISCCVIWFISAWQLYMKTLSVTLLDEKSACCVVVHTTTWSVRISSRRYQLVSQLVSHGAIVREIWCWGLYTKVCLGVQNLVTVGKNV
jgi:hypothetical protein